MNEKVGDISMGRSDRIFGYKDRGLLLFSVDIKISLSYMYPEGRPGMSDVSPLSGI